MNKEVWYTVRRTFDADYKEENFSWQKYIEWSRLYHLKKLVSLDGSLNHLLFEPNFNSEDEIKHIIIEENTVTAFFNSLEYAIEKSKESDYFNLLAVVKEPTEQKAIQLEPNFEFIGYDLIETYGDISALTNCGGFDETFLPEDLNEYGLISNFEKAVDIQKYLKINNPMEAHADCDLFEVWRHKFIGRK